MIKKIAAGVVALVLSISMLTGCNEGKNSSSKPEDSSVVEVTKSKLTIDGKEVDTDGLVMMTINDEYEVGYEEYRYYFLTLMDYINIDFSAIEDESERTSTYNSFKELVDTTIKKFYSIYILAEDEGISFSEENQATLDENYSAVLSTYTSAEELKEFFNLQNFNEDIYKQSLKHDILFEEIDAALFQEGGKYCNTKDVFLEFAKTADYANVKHILITFSSMAELSEEDKTGFDELTLGDKLEIKDEAYVALTEEEKKSLYPLAKTKIDEVLAKVAAGEDFDSLIKAYGWDAGMEEFPAGYFITKNATLPKEFVEATFNLKPGQTSEIVESDYGYHIIKREIINEEYFNKNVDSLYESYATEITTLKGNELLTTIIEEMKVTYDDVYAQINYDSIA